MRHHVILSLLCLMSLAAAARAQVYAIDWFTLDGGGGPSAGGGFSLNGTLGQPDAGAMSGGAFTVSGGFWPAVTDFAPGPLPALSIRHGIGNTVILIWPHPSTGYVLHQATDLTDPPSRWTPVLESAAILLPNWEVRLQATEPFRVFRLFRPN